MTHAPSTAPIGLSDINYGELKIRYEGVRFPKGKLCNCVYCRRLRDWAPTYGSLRCDVETSERRSLLI